MGHLDLDAERLGQCGEAPLPRQWMQPARERHGAQHGRVGPAEPGAVEGLPQHPPVEGRVVRDEDAVPQELGELGERRLGRRGGVDHRLRDPGEPLDAARERRAHADQRLPAVVELPAPDEHRADLGELARVTREAVGLGVDDEELRGPQRAVEHLGRVLRAPDGRQRPLRRVRGTGPARPAGGVRCVVHRFGKEAPQ